MSDHAEVPTAELEEELSLADTAPQSKPNGKANGKANLQVVGGNKPPTTIPWQAKLLYTGGKKGAPKKLSSNGMVALRGAPAWKDVLTYNAFSLAIIVNSTAPYEKSCIQQGSYTPRVWTDQDYRKTTEWFQHNRIDIDGRRAEEAVQTIAEENQFHPVRAWLSGLEWDSRPRLNTWLIKYLGALDDERYCEIVGAKWLISAIARIHKPGCKVDCMLVLEGEQGLGKSTALAALVPNEEWFSDEVRNLGTKDCAMSLAGKWILEFSELEAFKGASVEKLKSFLSQTGDRFRPPYGKTVSDYKRQCVFAGTTNQGQMLSDPTGNRRYWPVACTKIELDALIADREQLWAEAQVRYLAGEKCYLITQEEKRLAHEAQERRFQTDILEPRITDYLKGKAHITLEDVATYALDLEVEKIPPGEQRRIRGILLHIGWFAKTIRDEKGKAIWAYCPKHS